MKEADERVRWIGDEGYGEVDMVPLHVRES